MQFHKIGDKRPQASVKVNLNRNRTISIHLYIMTLTFSELFHSVLSFLLPQLTPPRSLLDFHLFVFFDFDGAQPRSSCYCCAWECNTIRWQRMVQSDRISDRVSVSTVWRRAHNWLLGEESVGPESTCRHSQRSWPLQVFSSRTWSYVSLSIFYYFFKIFPTLVFVYYYCSVRLYFLFLFLSFFLFFFFSFYLKWSNPLVK